MTLKSGSGQACAACKYQRRRCTSECVLAPFFPADQMKMFQNVHRLFGVKNIVNTLRELDPDQKAIAMKSMKFQATMRDKYPVYGCLVEIQQLSYQIQLAEEELQAVLQQLAYYRQSQQQEMSPTNDYLSQLQLAVAPPPAGIPAMPVLRQENVPPDYGPVRAALPVASYSNAEYLDSRENNGLWVQQQYGNVENENADQWSCNHS
ncbi:LOB domain-containing protein 27-like [Dorcoceras hygrometricum]|uniref:LOB domain-containing protein 27-like n=1 Tax=Dorcoceras hygrometricum TaxID=472368 RepID=A0A2Z7DCG7_9LAMI|nr:LOB domain-containing protein 27-like [Dorcoceras hygrometricum]